MKLVPEQVEEAKAKPPFTVANYLIVAVKKAFILAWPRICVDGFDPLCDENTTNRKMGRALNELLASGEISTFNYEFFETIPVNSEGESAQSSGKEYRAFDLILRPTGLFDGGNKQNYGIFVECKCLRNGGNDELSKYVSNGIYRFVHDGDYAHCMTHAMMVGYSEGSLKFLTLLDYIKTSTAIKVVICACKTHGFSESIREIEILKTTHERTFDARLGDIEIEHLWLSV